MTIGAIMDLGFTGFSCVDDSAARFLQPLPQVEQVVLQDESARASLLRGRTERHVWIRGDDDDHCLWMETDNLTRCPDAVARGRPISITTTSGLKCR